ncbi:MAG TPA: glycosyl hydrolase [Candidatus Dormibacteraeota bacterium]|nr:glycosyl hydrolase [Candidatus Dormibacteraeota bacterium]
MSGRVSTALSVVLAMLVGAATVAAVLELSGRVHIEQLPVSVPGRPSPSAAPLAGVVQPSAGGTYWGAFVPGAQTDQSIVTSFASAAGHEPAILTIYQQWWGEPAFPAAAASRLAHGGTVLLLVWEPWRAGLPTAQAINQPAYRPAAIAAGAFDRYVRRYADQVRAYGGPLLLEPFHEMNGNWYPWGATVNGNTAADYVAAWRHLHDLFAAEGATNATWVWTTNRDTVPDTAANQPAAYWPGAAYVDWVGLDAYNWGTAERKQWTSVAETFNRSLASLRAYGKPIIVAETGCAEQGGDKAAWIADLFSALTGPYRGVISAAVWFNEPFGVFDWRTNSSPAAQAAFRAGVARPGMLPAGSVAWSTTPTSAPSG